MRNRLLTVAGIVVLALGLAGAAAKPPISTDGSDPRTWDPRTDGPIAAPENHKVVYEDDNIRIISVLIVPGQTEKVHGHMRCAVLVFDEPAKIQDHDGQMRPQVVTTLLGNIHWPGDGTGPPSPAPFIWLQPPEALHAITNNDTHPMHLTRLELKHGCAGPWPPGGGKP